MYDQTCVFQSVAVFFPRKWKTEFLFFPLSCDSKSNDPCHFHSSQTCLQQSTIFFFLGGWGGGGRWAITTKIYCIRKIGEKILWKGWRGRKFMQVPSTLGICRMAIFKKKGILIFLILCRCSCLGMSTYRFLKLRRICVLWASLQELWIESFRILIICFIVSRAFSIWKLSGCPASVYFESCCKK